MKRFYIIILLIISVLYASFQLYKLRDGSSPSLRLNSNQHKYFADVGGIQSIKIRLENLGRQDLILTNVSTSCGCITPVLDHLIIKGESESVITLVFRDVDGAGKRNYQIVARTNDPQMPVFTYDISVHVFDSVSFKLKAGNGFELRARDNQKGMSITNYNIESPVDWIVFNDELVDGVIHGNVIPLKRSPEGRYDARIRFNLTIGKKVLTKIVSYPFYKPSSTFSTVRPFTTAVFKNETLSQEIEISGGDLKDYIIEYSGSELFDSSVKLKDDKTLVLKMIPRQNRYGYTERGHIFLFDKINKSIVFSHPVYIRY